MNQVHCYKAQCRVEMEQSSRLQTHTLSLTPLGPSRSDCWCPFGSLRTPPITCDTWERIWECTCLLVAVDSGHSPCVKDRTALLSPPCCSSCYHHHVTLLMHLSRCKHINSNMSGYFFPKKEFQGILIFALFDHCGVGPASAHKSSDIVVTHTVVILYTLRFIVSIAWSTSQLFTNMYLFSNVKIFLYTFPGLAICCHCILVLNQHLNAYLIFSFTSRSSPVLRRISCASLF